MLSTQCLVDTYRGDIVRLRGIHRLLRLEPSETHHVRSENNRLVDRDQALVWTGQRVMDALKVNGYENITAAY